ncbi:O-methyltransferase [Alteribacter aurantiacus]|uniref:O-methyltransferase n=1 Tax=Alteribacter aurantiacus TaxID=254410 RepID=UPI00040B8F8E|nr:O-methyltransferase [Alteribacter aurantiacus]
MEVNDYIKKHFAKEDEVLLDVIDSLKENNMPTISVPSDAGKLLYLLVKIANAKKVLEVGALGGYSGIWMGRAIPEDGSLTSLELDEKHVDVAKLNMKKAGLDDKVEYLVGDAMESFTELVSSGETFDFFFIDADKENYVAYVESALLCAEPGALIVADNVLWGGKVTDETNDDEQTEAIRAFNRFVSEDPRLEATILPVGDGVMVSRVIK